jgi:hypothetical protein
MNHPEPEAGMQRMYPHRYILFAVSFAICIAWYLLVYNSHCNGVMEACGPGFRWASILWGGWITAITVLVLYLAGNRFLGRFFHGLETGTSEDRIFVIIASVVTGYWLLQILLFPVFLFHMQFLLAPLFAISVLYTIWNCPQVSICIPGNSGSREASTIILLSVLSLFPAILMLLLPDINWDSAGVHLPLAQRFANDGIGFLSEDYSAWIMASGVHLVYGLFLVLDAREAIGWLNFMALAGTLAAGWSFTRKFWGERAGAYAVLALASTGLLIQLALDARIDGFLALFTLVAVMSCLWPASGKHQANHLLLLSAIALGNALGVKYLAVIPAAVVGMVLLVRAYTVNGKSIPARLFAAGLVFIVLPSSSWYLMNAWHTGDPLYPYIHGKVQSFEAGERKPLYRELDRLLDEDQLAEVPASPMTRAFLQNRQGTAGKVPSLLNPFSVFLDYRSHGRVPLQNAGILLLAFFLVPFFYRDKKLLLVAGLGLVLYMAIGWKTYLLRYAVFAIPVMTVASAAVLSKFRASHVGPLVMISGLMSLLYLDYYQMEIFLNRHPVQWLSGSSSEVRWLQTPGYDGDNSMPLLVQSIAKEMQSVSPQITANDRILFVGESKAFLLPVQAIPDISRYGYHWTRRVVSTKGDFAAMDELLEKEGITFIAVNYRYLDWVTRHVPLKQKRFLYFYNHLHAFLARYASEWKAVGGIRIYRLEN